MNTNSYLPPRPPVPPAPPMPPKSRPLQLKRGTARAFAKYNPFLLEGQPAFEIDTNRLKIGDGKRLYNDLKYIGEEYGKSAYEIWLDQGNQGSIDDFLQSLEGEPGKSTYELWLAEGHEGTIADFLATLEGDDAYVVWRDQFMHDPTLTVDDFIMFMTTTTWAGFND